MAKQLNVNMSFTADTSKAKQAIIDLQQSIQKLAYGTAPTDKLVDPVAFEKASVAARELAFHLNKAYNAKTGNLDLNKLNASLKASKTSLTELTSGFKNAGADGQKAFTNLANAIAKADLPTLSINSHLSTMLTTLKNVARFQISSSIIHGAIGAIKSAYGYAQDLNESLNNIRIVTGQSTEQMAHFAQQANKAAGELSTTTLDYTKASLIYYQQGLSDADVKARTDVTVKMANVTRQSAEEVSNQMTAIWNNFDNGSHTLEYYADVITALGAKTASSSQEIAAGLEKFAAVADTVGLSYENATAALATITATTRQSADTVGTGLRTLFSRLQGLKLGETLEDGVDLNKYSKALETVGVHALDASGELRSMDDILEDLGERWAGLGDAQKTALAQTVGGVRQYTNLIALMDNFDFYKQNQETAANAEGTLGKQADIYAQSWEASQKRVKAAAEGIYSALIDDEFFIKFNGFLEHLLKGVKNFIGAFGGIGPILLQVGGLITGIFANKIGPVIQSAIQNIQVLMGGANKVYNKIQNEMTGLVNQEISSGDYTGAQAQELQNANQLLAVRMKLSAVESQLSNSEKMRANIAIQGLEIQQQAVVKLQQEYDELAEKQERSSSELLDSGFLDNADYDKFINPEASRQMKTAKITESSSGILDTSELDKIQQTADQAAEMLENARLKLLFALTGDGIEGGKVNLNELFSFDISSFQQQINDIESGIMEEILNLQNIDDAQKLHIMDLLFENGENASLESIEKVTNEIKQAALDQIDTLKADVTDDQKVHLKELLLSEDGNISSEGLEAFNEAIKELGGEGVQALEPLMQTLEKLSNGTSLAPVKNQINLLTKGFGNLGKQFPKVQSSLTAISKAKTPKALQNGLQQLDKALKSSEIDSKTLAKSLENLGISKADIASYQKGEKTLSQLFDTIQQKKDKLNNTKLDFSHQVTGVEVFARIGSAAMSAASALNAIKSLGNIWNNDDATVGEKLVSTFMTLGMLIPSLTSAFSSFQVIGQGVTQMIQNHAAASAAAAGADSAAAGASQLSSTAMDKAALSAAKAAVAKTGVKITTMALATEEGRQALISELVSKGMDKETASMYVNKAATSGLNIIKMAFLAISGKITMAQFKEMAARAAESGSLWANTAAWIANQIAKNGWAGLVLGGLLIAAIAATTIAVIANSKSVSQNTEEQIKANKAQTETAKKTTELVNAWRDQNEEMDVLISKYNQLTAGAEGYDEAVQAIIDKAPDLIEKYEDLQDKLGFEKNSEEAREYAEQLERLKNATAAGDQDAIIAANNRLEQLTTHQAVQDAEKGFNGAVATTALSWQKHGDTDKVRSFDRVEGNKVWMDVDGDTYADYKTGEILRQQLKAANANVRFTSTLQRQSDGSFKGKGYDMQFALDTGDSSTFVQQYEAMLAAKAQMEEELSAEDLADSDLYKELTEILERSKDDYETVKQFADDLEKYKIDDIVANEMSADVTSLKSYAEYENYKKELLERVSDKAREEALASGKSTEEAEQAAQAARDTATAWLEANDALSEYTKTEKRLNYIGDRFGKDQQKKVTEYYKGLSDEDKKLFMQIDLDKAYSEKALNIEIARLKTLAEKQKIEVQIKTITDAKKNLKESGMTQEDWAKIGQGIDWDEVGISFEDFMNMTYSQQKEFLETTEKNLNDKYPKIIQKQIEEGNAALEEAKNHQTETQKAEMDASSKLAMMEHGFERTSWGEVRRREYTQEEIEAQRKIVEEKRLENDAAKDGVELEEQNLEQLEQERIIQERLAEDRVRDKIAEASSLIELNNAMREAGENGVEYSYELVSSALQKMAENYDNCSNELAEYQQILVGGTQQQIEAAELTLRNAIAVGEMSEALDLNAESIEEHTKALMNNVEGLENNEATARRSAIITQSMQKGIDELSKSWADQKKILTAENKATKEYADTILAVKKNLAQLLGITNKDFIPDGFLEMPETLELMDKAAKGDVKAINRLGLSLAKASVEALKFVGQSKELIDPKLARKLEQQHIELDTGNALENFESYRNTVINGINQLDQAIVDGSIKAGDDLGNAMGNNVTTWANALNEMAKATNMSVEEMNNLLNSMGVQADITTTTKKITSKVPVYHTVQTATGDYMSGNFETWTKTNIDHYEDMPGEIEVAQINMGDDAGTPPTVTYAGRQGGGGGGSSGGGGGGGGGSKKPSKPERYHEIRKKIEDNSRKLEDITREKDRATGTAKLDLLQQEIALRQEAIALQQEYLNGEDGIQEWLNKDKEALIAAYQELGLAVEFDSEGRISNWSKLQEEYLKLELELTEEEKEKWNEAQEAADQYEESLQLLKDEMSTLQEQMEAEFDLRLEGVELKVQLDIDISDDKMAYFDYLLEKIDDDAYEAAQAIALLGDKTAETMRKIETYQNGINDILNLHGLTMDDLNNLSPDELRNLGLTDQEVSDLREYRDALLDANKELLEMRTTIVDKVIDAFEQLNEKVQKAYEKFDQYNSVLEHYKNLSDLLIPSLGKQSKILMDQLNNAMFNNAKNQAAAARKVYEEAQKQWAEAKAGYDAAVASGDDNAIKEYERILDTLTENLNEAQDNWLSAWEASLEQAQVIFEAAMENIQAEYDATLGGTFGSLDYLQQAYDRQKELNDQYLQDYDRLYELSKLSRNISAAIDDTDSIKAKERLRALQAEINKLQADGTKLSEYDVQVLEKRFELEQARLALDDAQNAKSQVRLQRDAEGNWGYVYTADEDAVAKAEQEYEDKLHEYQQLNDEYITQLQDQALEVQAQYRDAYMEIMNDTSLTDEERKARVDELNNWLAGQMNFFNEQLEHALTNQHSTLQRYYDAYGDLNAQLVDTWGETTLAEVLGMETMEGFMGNWQGAVDQMISAAAEAWEKYRRQQDEANEAAGVSTEDVADHIASQISAIGTYSDEAKDQVSQLSEELTGEFTDAMKAALEWEEKYAQAIDDAVNKNEAFIISLNKMITALAGLEGQISWDFSGATQSSEQFGSGGYTGAWGPNGKLAVLHEKELVLNKEDTAKFLDALQILKMIDLSANWMQQGFGDFIGAPTIGELAQTLDQQVSINASFPGVKDRYEIEEAFNNLVNKASQYANRKESY